jgi:hypothetical protein
VNDAPDVPPRVLQFIADKIDTVPELEALLLMWESPARAWLDEEIARSVYVTTHAAMGILQSLERRNLVCGDEHQPRRYAYSNSWDTCGDLMAEVAAAYRRHLIQVATFIHSNGSASIREFARAFDLKKDR